MFCSRCGHAVEDGAAVCPRCGSQMPGAQAGGEQVPSHLVLSILVTLFCCMPVGVAAIVYSAQVGGKQAAGDVEGARRSSRIARNLIIGSAVAGLVAFFLYMSMMAAVALPNFAKYRTESMRNACISNMKMIECAAEQCQMCGKKPTDENLYGPDKYIKSKLSCPMGGQYILESDGSNVKVICPNAAEGHKLPTYD